MRYDVFISSKSEDYSLSEGVYNYLHDKGFSVFLASKELEQIGEAQYRNAIDAAIDAATHMIVIASSIENIHSKWVSYEWSIFSNDINSGYRDGNLITILAPNVKLKDLPAGLRHQQSFSIQSYQSGILGYLKKKEENRSNSLALLKLVSDMDIQVFIDGNLINTVQRNKTTNIEIKRGVYCIRFVSVDNPEVYSEESALWIKEEVLSYSVKLLDIYGQYQKKHNQAIDLIKKAEEILEKDEYDRNNQDQAAAMVDKAIEICPNSIPALWKKLDLLNHVYTSDREEQQDAILAKIIQIEPDNLLALLKNAINLFKKGKIDEAIKIFDKVAETDKDGEYKAFAFNNIGACLMKNKNFENALALCNQALTICEKYEFLYNKGICLYRLNQFEKACDCFERITIISKEAKSYFYIALCCMNLNQYVQAVSNIRKYLEQDVTFKYHSDNMNVYIDHCMYDEVTMLSDKEGSICFGYQNSKYLKDSKFAIRLYACFAQALELMNRNQEALECYQRILGYDRTNGFAIEGIKNLDHSISNKIAPMTDDMQNIYNQAIKLYEEKGPREALKVLNNAELQYGDDIHYELLSLIGKYYDRMGEKEKAFSYFIKTLSIYRHQPSILLRLAYYYSEKEDDYSKSQKIYEEIIRDKASTDDDKLFAHNNLGILYCEMGEYEKALHCYEKVLEIGYSGEIFFNKAYALLKLTRYQEALDFFTKAIEKDPKLLTVTELYKACCHVGIGNKNAAMKILKHPLSEKLDKSVKEIVAGLNGCRYYYYGIPVSSATRYIYKFEENLEFIMNLCLCIGSTFENLNNKGKAKETYELMLKLDPNNTFAKLAIRRLDTSFWDKLFS